MGTTCDGRHMCEPDFYPSSTDDRWTCPDCNREHFPFDVHTSATLPEIAKRHVKPGALGWTTARPTH